MAVNAVVPLQASALPTRTEFDAARRAMSNSFAELEGIKFALTRYSEAYYGDPNSPANAPDDAYIGALYRFLDDVRIELAQSKEIAGELQRLLVDVDCIGRDADVRRRRAS